MSRLPSFTSDLAPEEADRIHQMSEVFNQTAALSEADLQPVMGDGPSPGLYWLRADLKFHLFSLVEPKEGSDL